MLAAPSFSQSRLITFAGLSQGDAAGISLNQIAAAKANPGVSCADRRRVADNYRTAKLFRYSEQKLKQTEPPD